MTLAAKNLGPRTSSLGWWRFPGKEACILDRGRQLSLKLPWAPEAVVGPLLQSLIEYYAPASVVFAMTQTNVSSNVHFTAGK